MKFEEVLPALRVGSFITCAELGSIKIGSKSNYTYYQRLDGERVVMDIPVELIMACDTWEVI